MSHPFPRSVVDAEAPLIVIFTDEAARLGINRSDAEHLFSTIPASVRAAPAVRFVFNSDWRYAFGKLFNMDDGSHGFGIPHQAPQPRRADIATSLFSSCVRVIKDGGMLVALPH